MNRAAAFAVAGEPAVELELAAGVARHDVVSGGAGEGAALHLGHRGGDHRKLHAEEAAKAAAALHFIALDKLQVANVREQRPRSFLDPQLPQAVAAVVVGDGVGKAGSDVGHAELVNQELPKLKRPRGQVEGGGFVWRSSEQFRIEDPHHGHARPTRADDGIGSIKEGNRPDRQLLGLVPVAGVETRLPAAGLPLAKLDGVAEVFEHPRHRKAHLRSHLIDEARDEEADVHGTIGASG